MTSRDMRIVYALEFCTCVVLAAVLTYVVQGAFYIADSVHAALWLTFIVSAALQALLFASVWRPRAKTFLLAGYGAAAVLACIVAVAASPAESAFADVPENGLVAVVVFFAVNLAVFLGSRTRTRSVILFAIGSFTCGYIQFLYVQNMLFATIAFVAIALGLIALKSYSQTCDTSADVSGVPVGRATLAGAALAVLPCLAAVAVVLAFIMPLNPPHATIKLFNEELAYEEEYVKNAVELSEDSDNVVTSSNVDSSLDPRTTTDKKIDENSDQPDNGQSAGSAKDYLSGKYSDVDFSGMLTGAQALALNAPIPWPWIVLIVIAAIALLLTVPRFIVHRLRLRRIAALGPAQQVREFYRFFTGRLGKLGFAKPDLLSPVEYANAYRARISDFVGAQEADSFDYLTYLFVRQQYGGDSAVGRCDLDALYHLYNRFYYNCRKKLGLVKYGLRYMFL